MFHKEGSIEGSSKKAKAMDVPIRKSDRRQLRKRVNDFFQQQEQEALETILDVAFLQGTLSTRNIPMDKKACKMVMYLRSPNNNDNNNNNNDTKSNTEKKNNPLLYFVWPFQHTTQFIWMSYEEKNKVISNTPTVAMWSILANYIKPERMIQHYAIQVPSPVSKFLCRGADLMRAGMRTMISSRSNNNDNDNNNNNMVAIVIQGNYQPLAVGKIKDNISSLDQIGPNSKGVGVEIWNCYGDDIWQSQYSPDNERRTNSINPIGGSSFDNGHYGNVGFMQGKLVVPLQGQGEQDDDDDDDNDENNGQENDGGEEAEAAEGTANANNDNEHVQNQESTDTLNDNNDDTTTDDNSNTPDFNDADTTKPNNDSEKQEQEEQEKPTMTPDDVLHLAVCQALLTLSKKDLPMNISVFYAQHVIPNRPNGTTIQLKATKYKKFGVYLTEQVQCGLLNVGPNDNDKNNKDPMAFLTSFNPRHDDLIKFKKSSFFDTVAPVKQSSNNQTQKKLIIVDLYIIPTHWQSLLQLNPDHVCALHATSSERRGTGMLTGTEIRTMLDEYITREELQDVTRPDQVVLNGPLTDALYKQQQQQNKNKKNSENIIPLRVPRKDLVKLWASKMSSAYALVEMPGSQILQLQKGSPPKILIEVSMRQSKKFVTRVRGLEDYGIDPVNFSKDVARRFACSSAVETDPEGRAALKKGRVELVFQGNLIDELKALLVDENLSSHGGAKGSDYRVPKNVIEVITRKGVQPKKKKGGAGKKK